MELSKYEQETIINYNQEVKTASCYTHDRALMRKLDALCNLSSEIVVSKPGCVSREYTFPKKWLKIRPPRQLSEKSRQEMAQRAAANFAKR